MKLQNYLVEERIKTNKILNLLDNKCRPMMREVKSRNGFFYRGIEDPITSFKIKRVRDNRRPKDINPFTSEIIDDELEKKFGWRPRSQGVFAYPSKILFKSTAYLFFPMGPYEYIWNPLVKDLFYYLRKKIRKEMNYDTYSNDVFLAKSRKNIPKKTHEKLQKIILDIVDTYIDAKIGKLKYEVIFKIPSKKYVLISLFYEDKILKHIMENY
jgi:hypothetical protein